MALKLFDLMPAAKKQQQQKYMQLRQYKTGEVL